MEKQCQLRVGQGKRCVQDASTSPGHSVKKWVACRLRFEKNKKNMAKVCKSQMFHDISVNIDALLQFTEIKRFVGNWHSTPAFQWVTENLPSWNQLQRQLLLGTQIYSHFEVACNPTSLGTTGTVKHLLDLLIPVKTRRFVSGHGAIRTFPASPTVGRVATPAIHRFATNVDPLSSESAEPAELSIELPQFSAQKASDALPHHTAARDTKWSNDAANSKSLDSTDHSQAKDRFWPDHLTMFWCFACRLPAVRCNVLVRRVRKRSPHSPAPEQKAICF